MNISATPKKLCTGCGACANICKFNAIEMLPDKDGFLYPNVSQKLCVDCSVCFDKCPINFKISSPLESGKCFAAYNKNEEIVKKSSSGGVFYALAENVLKDGGCVVGARFNEEMTLITDIAYDTVGLIPLMGSKYVQSRTGFVYNEIKKLIGSRKVLFVGTPCQTAALKNVLGKDADSDNLLTCAIFCHGVASEKAFKSYISEEEKKKKVKAVNVYFRDKTVSWDKYSMKINFDDGSDIVHVVNEDSYLRAFINNLMLRPSCHNCSFKNALYADLFVGDFWGVKNTSHTVNEMGVSAVIASTEKGQKALVKANLKMEKSELSLIKNENTALVKSPDPHKNREAFFKKLKKDNFGKLYYRFLYEFYEPPVKRLSNKVKLAVKKVIK